jgi:signal transduction histidine kinase
MRAIGEEATQLTHLADDLQELALADAGSLSLVLCPESVPTLIEHAVTNARARIAALGIDLVVELDPDLPLVRVDSQRITQVLNNLLSNAASYSKPGSTIIVGAAKRYSLATNTPEVVVTVSDRGCGIPAEELEHIFDRFDRVDPSRMRATGGSGLGLTIGRSIIAAHGGEIHAENRDGGGSRLVFTLPCPARHRR